MKITEDTINNLKNTIKNSKNMTILCHHNADPDAIGSALSMQYLVNLLNKNCNVRVVCDSISALSKSILKEYELSKLVEVEEYPKLGDTVIFVDTSNLNQLKIFEEELSNKNLIIIDHHKKTSLYDKCNLKIINENSTSTCEIVSYIFKYMNIFPPKYIRELLLCGIVYDTKHLKKGKGNTFEIIGWLIKKINYQKILYLLSTESDISKRIAHLKSCSRMDIKMVDDYIVSLSHASSYESSCAKTIVSIGADIAFVVAVKSKNREIRVSARCRPSVSKKISLAYLMEKIGKMLNGEGGGHAEAAGLNAHYEKGRKKEDIIKEVLNICYNVFKEEIKKDNSIKKND